MRLAILLLFFSFVLSLRAQPEEKAVQDGFAFLYALIEKNGDQAFSYMDTSVRSKISPAELNTLWRQVELGLQLGGYLDTQGYLFESPSLHIGLVFAKGPIDLKVTFAPGGGVIGFFFEAPTDKTPYRIPEYADTSRFSEISLPLQSGKNTLPGKLCLPKGEGPFPLVVLSHGSGPNGMDEKLGPNRIFRDIAYGLASQGIAVYRFHKRTYVYGLESAENSEELTVKEEYLDDLYSAIDTLMYHPQIDSARFFLMGHSLGALLAPRVALGSGKLRGIILAAAPVQPLDSLVLYQMEFLNALDSSGTYYRALNDTREEIAYLRSPEFSLETESNWLPLQLNAHYWMDILNYNAVDSLKKYPGYALILQAEDDYQVPYGEYVRWQNALKKRKKTYYASFPGLGHGFFPSEGLKGPEQYNHYAPVSKDMIVRVVRFVRKEAN
ncbi:MAG: alpha/beta hydrolase [Bacteroidia bacterium]